MAGRKNHRHGELLDRLRVLTKALTGYFLLATAVNVGRNRCPVHFIAHFRSESRTTSRASSLRFIVLRISGPISTTIARITHWKGERRIRQRLAKIGLFRWQPNVEVYTGHHLKDSCSLRYSVNVITNSR